ncbi:MAG: bifunctional adenosylcobinamide kinase/adenosylcobinamide-phosphate guanylyltransferase [Deltaproteobacteria bacterium]|nr:MAG: bifunctional adenosylcobinamide kinase/adenosylcobinamide-phosphate guanylyltransferase [Deltaproteobacteria bacterium]
MADLVLVTGGTRSGKSDFALNYCSTISEKRCFIATCEAGDAEMAKRVAVHKKARKGQGWDTIEEPRLLVETVASLGNYEVLLIDCLTLWVTNLLYQREQEKKTFDAAVMLRETERLASAVAAFPGRCCCCVTNEVGQGIVPANPVARKFRDLAGICNQTLARHASEVYLVSCGIPLPLKALTS